jgi:hypothetical protein
MSVIVFEKDTEGIHVGENVKIIGDRKSTR